MFKKHLIIISILIIFSYIIFIQYKAFNYNKELNNLIKEKVKLDGNYNDIAKEVSSIKEEIKRIADEKVNVTTEMTTKQETLKKTNDDIHAIEVEINKRKKNQAKQNIYSGSGDRIAYLTFDDGPSSNTDAILDILSEYGVKVTYFINGRSDEDSFKLYRRIVNEGHTIGNHVYSHNYAYIYSSVSDFDYYFNKLQDLVKVTTGITMNIMRFPGGSNNNVSNHYNYGIMNTLTTHYKELGYTYYDWNVSSGDGASSGVTNTSVINNVINGCKNKSSAIILMHDTKKTTINTLETIIVSLSDMGFKFLPITSATHAIQFK